MFADPNLRVAALSVLSALVASSCPPEEMYAILEGRFGGQPNIASSQQRAATACGLIGTVQSVTVARSYAAAASATPKLTSTSASATAVALTAASGPPGAPGTCAAASALAQAGAGPAGRGVDENVADDDDREETGVGDTSVGGECDSASVASSLVSRSSVRAVAPSAPRSALLAALSTARLVC